MTRVLVRLRALAVAMAAVLVAGCTASPTTGSDVAHPAATAASPVTPTALPATRNPPTTPRPTRTPSDIPLTVSTAQPTTDPAPTTHAPARPTSQAPARPTPHVPNPHVPARPTPRPPAAGAGPSSATRPGRPTFVGSVADIDAGLAERMSSSFRPDCPVPLADLSYLRLSYLDFDGHPHLGEMVVARSVSTQVVAVFRKLYLDGSPIRRMSLVDDFGGSDDASMAADNTSGFNCRPTTGGRSFSQHSYGLAIDINPTENPYVGDGQILPPAGSAFASRPHQPGVVHDGDAVVSAFASIGWRWGGDWADPKDYQHFSANGR